MLLLAKADSFFTNDYYKQALSIYETIPVLMYNLKQIQNRAVCEKSLGKYHEAESSCFSYLQKDSLNSNMYILRAQSLIGQNTAHPQYDCVIADYTKAIAIHENGEERLRLLGYKIASLQQFVQDYKLQKLDWNHKVSKDVDYCKDFLEQAQLAEKLYPELKPKIAVYKNAYWNLLNPKSLPINPYHD